MCRHNSVVSTFIELLLDCMCTKWCLQYSEPTLSSLSACGWMNVDIKYCLWYLSAPYTADIDECDSSSTCHQDCNNNEGSYTCSCFSGYELLTDGRNCIGLCVHVCVCVCVSWAARCQSVTTRTLLPECVHTAFLYYLNVTTYLETTLLTLVNLSPSLVL